MVNTTSTHPRRFSSAETALSPIPRSKKSPYNPRVSASTKTGSRQSQIFDDPVIVQGYESVPLIEIDTLPRGGISMETKAVGRVQFGIPPETIKDSMLLGIEVPSVYIVPVERFCREMGPALGINMAEFEFPAYFNYFIRQKRCALVVDSLEAERDICNVFEETLLGPNYFRNHDYPCANVDEDFDPSYLRDARPNFYKEFYHFRTAEKSANYQELTVSTLLDFVHYDAPSRQREGGGSSTKLGVPPTPAKFEIEAQPPVRASEAMILENRRKDEYSFGSSREESYEISPTDRPMLYRSNSDSSRESQSTQKSHNTVNRRNSIGSVASSDSEKKTPGYRRSSMPVMGGIARPPLGGRFDTERSLDGQPLEGRRDSVGSSFTSMTGRISRTSRVSTSVSSAYVQSYDFLADDAQEESTWMYSQVKWLGEVATVYPTNATEEQKRTNTTARVEIFKMAGGTEYIIHDVDENNVIVGKVRFSGSVRVPDEFSVEGFISNEGMLVDDYTDRPIDDDDDDDLVVHPHVKTVAPTFHPPSFGVTVLGNSHGFDKNGSTSGYVLWVNGRGIMIDPPPYSSATLEREGIRPQMIMAIIITHCHADHDAGAFQKVMTGSRVAIITTPTIYKSFIRKYSALSGLRPSLLRHSHRHRPAIVGQPLRFQGAVFHFTYTLHTIPCLSFKVEWRGKSIVFTGDHMNIPEMLDKLENKGVLSNMRANDLRGLPIQECDVLLHEAGAPPIHTPLDVLKALPDHVKARLYVVHTAAIPPDSGLRVAPTGTAGTIRLDSIFHERIKRSLGNGHVDKSALKAGPEAQKEGQPPSAITVGSLQDGKNQNLTIHGNYSSSLPHALMKQFDGRNGRSRVAPLVFLRPTDVSDAWFILNLMSAVPFLSSLSYAHTMEILEIAQVEMYSAGEVVVEGPRRPEVLCVFWEGTCVSKGINDAHGNGHHGQSTVWHAGDWTGPVSLQPDIGRSAHVAPGQVLGDIVALSEEGVKVIVLKMKDILKILKTGSKLFRKYSALMEEQERQNQYGGYDPTISQPQEPSSDEILDVIQCNSVLRNLTAMQKRYLESLAEGPRHFAPHTLLWKVGDPVDYAFLIVGGTATLGKKMVPKLNMSRMSRRGSTGAISSGLASIEEDSRGRDRRFAPIVNVEADKLLQNVQPTSEYARLEVSLQVRAEELENSMEVTGSLGEYQKQMVMAENASVQAYRDRFANKVLARLYSRRAYTEHLLFSRGNLLSDTSRMVSGDLANISKGVNDGGGTRGSLSSGPGDHHCHTSNLLAGSQGVVAMVFPRSTLVPFLDSNPGVLLCLLGTQVVV